MKVAVALILTHVDASAKAAIRRPEIGCTGIQSVELCGLPNLSDFIPRSSAASISFHAATTYPVPVAG